MVKYLGITSGDFKLNIKSKRIIKKRLKIHKSINTIKKKFKLFLINRYKNLRNNLDDEIFTTEKVYMIPKKDLFIITLSNGDKMGCRSTNLLKWINNYSYIEIPKNIFTNEIMVNSDIKKCIYNVKKYANLIKKEDLNKYNELITMINSVTFKNKNRLNPEIKLKDIEDKILFHYNSFQEFLIEKCNTSYWVKFFYNKDIKTVDGINYLLSSIRNKNLLNLEEDNDIIENYKNYLKNLIIYYYNLKNKIERNYFYYFKNN